MAEGQDLHLAVASMIEVFLTIHKEFPQIGFATIKGEDRVVDVHYMLDLGTPICDYHHTQLAAVCRRKQHTVDVSHLWVSAELMKQHPGLWFDL